MCVTVFINFLKSVFGGSIGSKKSPSPLGSGLGDGERREFRCEEGERGDGVQEGNVLPSLPTIRLMLVCVTSQGRIIRFHQISGKGKKPPSPLESRLGDGERGECVREEGVERA